MKCPDTDRIKKHAPHWNDEVPQDPVAFREALSRRIHDFLGEWRTCRAPVCRRQRSCVNRDMVCSEGLPAATEREWARVRSKLLRALAAQKAINEKEMSARAAARSPGRKEPEEVIDDRAHRARGKPAANQRQQQRRIRARPVMLIDEMDHTHRP